MSPEYSEVGGTAVDRCEFDATCAVLMLSHNIHVDRAWSAEVTGGRVCG